jgi:hypothetical protein
LGENISACGRRLHSATTSIAREHTCERRGERSRIRRTRKGLCIYLNHGRVFVFWEDIVLLCRFFVLYYFLLRAHTCYIYKVLSQPTCRDTYPSCFFTHIRHTRISSSHSCRQVAFPLRGDIPCQTTFGQRQRSTRFSTHVQSNRPAFRMCKKAACDTCSKLASPFTSLSRHEQDLRSVVANPR